MLGPRTLPLQGRDVVGVVAFDALKHPGEGRLDPVERSHRHFRKKLRNDQELTRTNKIRKRLLLLRCPELKSV